MSNNNTSDGDHASRDYGDSYNGDDALGYALGALNAAEAREFEGTAAALGSADPLTPPPALKASIMAQIASLPQARPSEPVADQAPVAASPSGAEARARRAWFTRPIAVTSAAAAAVLLFVGGAVVGSALTPTSNDVSLDAIVAASDARSTTVPVEGGGTATIIASPHEGKSAIVVSGLDRAPRGMTYQLWYMHDGVATSAGFLDIAGSGVAGKVLTGSLSKGAVVGLTLEPEGGSHAPTTDPLLAVEVS